ncbi:tRNA pseudouridine(38-40) synthase TruA [Wenyingzhuangia marina]|uniref:tRNA pseudouridine synthase A n=1 Tax=Wenyingzhuangia marina TaxID=1195760 RepID=A0A1M5UPF8_9FLAO|nr:tRNA pseudouridine(38-40) synthase TruA [Wenyingzhuangia marina]GGF66592.1 tRNA pseudouridine synthase A [Wenyingzhuangia marina]SHH64796.1 tRNA pseudouridine38-40 synthase [Wenyingzhuangia marina]
MRYFAELSYLGKNYHGWQIQPNAISVQEVVQKSLSTILRTPIEVVAAGRTDAGVHASQMFIHFDTEVNIDSEVYCYKMNALLPDDIVFHKIFPVNKEAHTRFDAIKRSYEYRILLGRSPFTIDTEWQINQQLNIDAMNQAAKYLLDFTDFKCFSRSKTDVRTYNCDITRAEFVVNGNQLVFHISADRFLRNMVRAIVGTLYAVGLGKMMPETIKEIINSKERSNAGASAPAHGLFLTEIIYPENIKNVNE